MLSQVFSYLTELELHGSITPCGAGEVITSQHFESLRCSRSLRGRLVCQNGGSTAHTMAARDELPHMLNLNNAAFLSGYQMGYQSRHSVCWY